MPLLPTSAELLKDFSPEARALLCALGLENLLRDFDPASLLQAAAEMRAARIPLNVVLVQFVRDPRTVEDIVLRARIDEALKVIERLGGKL